MPEKQETQAAPGLADKPGIGGKSTLLAALITSMLALLLILMLWIYNPSYVVLLHQLDSETLTSVSAELQKHKIAFRYESESGNIFVPEKSLYHAKFVLGSKGIGQDHVSRQLLDINSLSGQQKNSLDPSSGNFALETELARTIASIDNIQWARVHLAIEGAENPGNKNNSTASVFVRLIPGRVLGESQIASIAYLVASSAANLSAHKITIIDQAGNLLKSSGAALPELASSTQYSYARMLEQSYIDKLEKVLNPIFGGKSIRVQVDADIDFKISNQNDQAGSQDRQSHVLKKLTTTVVIDNKLVKADDGQWVSIPRRNTELDRVEKLVKDTIEFNELRGDTVHVFNESFGNVGKGDHQNGGFLLESNRNYYVKVLLVVFLGFAFSYFVLRYLIQKIMEMKPFLLMPDTGTAEYTATDTISGAKEESLALSENDRVASTDLNTYETLLSKTRQQVSENPAHVARVIRSWVRDNGR